jgi:hypothetical protein
LRLSQWFIVDVDSVFGYLHHVEMDCVTNISEEYIVTVLRV